ncbi:MAG TPA: tetratricopeptide repeat protein [Vicinamibacterales bacterium]|nr:tetratricopeptide repeat protein [Vicinamibacterales bacterium]
MPVDRKATLKKAEKLLQQGKLAGAIEQYVKLVEHQPDDWSTINALGDLYVRVGDGEQATVRFVAVADHLFEEGFLPKAAAHYKKALKVKADHEHSLTRLVDIAERQGMAVDAAGYLRQLSKLRRERGDKVGVEECLIRLAKLADNSGDAQLKVEAETGLTALYNEVGRSEGAAGDLIAPALSVGEIRIETVTFEDADRVVPRDSEAVADSTPAADEDDADEPFVISGADMSGGEAMLAEPTPSTPVGDDAIVLDGGDADLNAALDALRAQALVLPPMPVVVRRAAGGAMKDLEAVFREIRSRVTREQYAQATEQYERGKRHLDDGRLIEALLDLQAAARTPIFRFKAAATLGRVLAGRGEYKDAVAWMERAIEAPPPTPDEGWSLLYELADALERLGEHERALATFLEIQTDSADAYRDLAERIERLREVTQGSARG